MRQIVLVVGIGIEDKKQFSTPRLNNPDTEDKTLWNL